MAGEDLDAAIRDLQRQRRGGRWRLYGIIVLAAIAPVVFLVAYPRYKQRQYERSLLLDAAGTRELRDLIGQLGLKAAECRGVWEKQTRPEALAALRIDPETGCAVDLPTVSEKEEGDYVEHASWTGAGYRFGVWGLHLVGADGKVDGGGGCTSEGLLTSLGESVDRGTAKKTALEEARRALNRPEGYDVVLLVTREEQGKFNWQPKLTVIDTFTPGRIWGRALVYSQSDRRFVCGGEIDARNSPTVKIHFTHLEGDPAGGRENKAEATAEVLKRDMEVQLRRRIASGLSALAGPAKQ